MPRSSPDIPVTHQSVRSYLQELLPEAQLSDTPVVASEHPLVLLRTDHLVAAFAFANGDPQGSYETLYAGFKKHCDAQHGQWDRLDLAFVLCVRPNGSDLDRFCSSVETDV